MAKKLKKITRVLIMAGGTGGHVFPALAVANALREQGIHVSWMGTKKGLEAKIAVQAGFPFYCIPIAGLRGKRFKTLLTAPFKILYALIRSLWVVLCVRPQVVLGMGGYVTGPGGLAAWLLRRRLVVHEQNAIPGLTNRLLSRLARQTLEAFPGTFKKALCTGNPVRADILGISSPEQRLEKRQAPLRLLVLGGSLGALVFNETVPKAISALNIELDVWHQTGRHAHDAVRAAYENFAPSAKVEPFIENMHEAYAWADLVLCRAGALTITELTAAGLPAILVPYPHAVDDHQFKNGHFLVSQKAAVMLRQHDFNSATLAEHLAVFSDRDKLQEMAKAAYSLRREDATQQVVAACLT